MPNKIFLEEISFNDGGKPKINFSLTIEESLEISMFSNDLSIPSSRILFITDSKKIQRHSDVLNILAFLHNCSQVPPAAEDVIKHCIKKLQSLNQVSESNDDDFSKKVEFLIEQLYLIQQIPQKRRYSTRFLWSAITWIKTSPALYNLIAEESFLTLPSSSYLKQLSGAFSLESGLSCSTVAYLKERIKALSDKEKTVALAIDEVSN
jgi:hypothetical protein